MANSYLTPEMSLTVPVPGSEPGPNWAYDLNSSLTVIDTHTHSAGSGVQITPSGININTDLTFNSLNNAISLRSVRFTAQGSPLSQVYDLGCLYVSGIDLYYNDENGNQIRLTNAGAVNAAPQFVSATFNSSASLIAGSGISASHTSTGEYTLSFTTAFAVTPVAVATGYVLGSAVIAIVSSVTTTGCVVETYLSDSLTNEAFSVIVTG